MGNRRENIDNHNDGGVAVASENTNIEAPAVLGVDKKNETVVVCLKHPQGIKFNLPNNRTVIINGNAVHLKGLKSGILPQGGFGMTTINREDWEYIKSTYGHMNIFKHGLIFANADSQSATSQAKEHDEVQSGLEPCVVGENTPVKDLKKVKSYQKEQ